MENFRALKIWKILITGTLALSPFFTFAYEPETTHKALTQEIIKVFNAYYPNLKIGDVEKSLVESGSVAEDDGWRALHHFYDPVYARGLAGQISAKDWVENTLAQASIFRPLAGAITGIFGAPTDYSWDRAVYDYVWVSKSRGLGGLGHILHLIEDMSVPDHTRNDAHPPYADQMFHQASPYEHWANKWNAGNIAVADKILSAGEKPKICAVLGECFESMAVYSNNNFFSKDTTPDKSDIYLNPVDGAIVSEVLKNRNPVKFVKNKNNNYRLAQIKFDFITDKKEYLLKDDDNLVLADYWSHLSGQAVLHGAGVVKLFFEAVEEERESKRLFSKNKSLTERLAGAMPSRLASIVGISPQPEPKPLISEIPASAFALAKPPIASQARAAAIIISPPLQARLPDGQGGEGGGNDVLPPGSVTNLGTKSPSENDLPFFLQLHAAGGGGTPGFGGGGEVNSPSSVKTPTSDIQPPILDTTSPDISLDVSECPGLASVSGECLLANSAVNVSWSSAAGDLNHYIVECTVDSAACSGFNFASTTATSTIYTLPADDAVYIFKAKAEDNAGNESGETAKTVSFSTRPIVINEVAWAGTAASSSDEWIELYNRSSKSANLANWVLRAEDGVPYINLSGTISAGGYYLIERTDDNAVSDIDADIFLPFSGAGGGSGLGNNGEVLILSHASTTIDQTPNCGANWSSCGGAASGGYPTMERIDPEVAGTDTGNWGTSNGAINNGLDSTGAALTATPRARNSLHYLIAQGTTLTADRTLKKSFGTYIIKNNETLIVPVGRTLTIEPGVTVKLGNDSKLIINGTLKAEGTASENITFTSLNNPAQHWKTINLASGALNSNIQYVKFEYGGRFFSDTPSEERAALSIVSNSTPVAHSVFRNSLSVGLRLTSSGSSVSANTFSVGTTTADNVGLYASGGGSPTISGNTFSQNYTGLYTTSSGNITDNVFNNNIDYPVYSLSGTANYSGNSGSGNGKNVIALTGSVATAGATTTLSANGLPYLTSTPPYNNAVIPAGAGAVIGAGAKMAGENNQSEFTVNGTLKLEGVSKDSIIFTSFLDSAPAEWSGILVSSTGRVYGGGFTLRYGGKGLGCPTCAGFRIEGGSVDLENAIIQNNFLAGMRFSGAATSTLDNFEFRDHQTPSGGSAGLVSSNSPLTLTNLTFSNNFANTSPADLYSPD